MPKFHELKTSLPNLVLVPLGKQHISFITSLLNNKEIQKTLFRIPTKVTNERQHNAIERMYSYEQPKEITYVLTLKSFLKSESIGFVKIKLIDWSVKSCYLSTAILPDQKYRGQGYAKAAYNAFFSFLFDIGIKKIYGRTYENNTATIKLNFATGFRFIGRQKNFIIYPNKTSLDAMFFEKLAPNMQTQGNLPYQQTLDELSDLQQELLTNPQLTSEKLNKRFSEGISNIDLSNLPADLQKYFATLKDGSLTPEPQFFEHAKSQQFQKINGEMIANLLKKYLDTFISISTHNKRSILFNRYSGTLKLPESFDCDTKQILYSLTLILVKTWRTFNQSLVGIQALSYATTKESQREEEVLAKLLTDQLSLDEISEFNFNESMLYAPLSRETRELLRTNLLGRDYPLSLSQLFSVVAAVKTAL